MAFTLLYCGACTDDEAFTTSPSKMLVFSTDSVKLDTCFSQTPTPTKTFWAFNKSGAGLRCSSIRLENGNQSGFRINVDGVYLGPERGYMVIDQEIRNKDSIRVFVELTSHTNGADEPKVVEDNLVFTLESGVQQKVNLNAYSWDADILRDITITTDSTLSGSRPTVIYGKLVVPEGKTLTIDAGKTVYFHGNAGLEVHGTLKSMGEEGNEVVLRGDRLDRMFDYLPYDGISGQWQGIHFHSSSYNNILTYTDLHGAFNAITCDSSDVAKEKLSISNSTIHNNQGHGLKSYASYITVNNSQITNCLGDLVSIYGGNIEINGCTLAQFYPFDANRGYALSFYNFEDDKDYPLSYFAVRNTIVTGYADDVVMGNAKDDELAYTYFFDHCMLRTPAIEDSINCVNVIWEDVKDTICSGYKNFEKIDTDLLQYNFHLSQKSLAIDAGSTLSSLPTDREGTKRDELPDIGCFEAIKATEPDNNQ